MSTTNNYSKELIELFNEAEKCYASNRYSEAVPKYKKAAELGHANAMYKLGSCILNGKGVTKDPKLGVAYIEKAAKQGDSEARWLLGNAAEQRKDYNAAANWYGMAADDGEARALYKFGLLLYNGLYCSSNYEMAQGMAFRKFMPAALQNFAPAERMVGLCCLYGRGTEKNAKNAVTWLEKASIHGDAQAQYRLGALYLSGTAIPQNFSQAWKYFNLAATNKYPEPGAFYFIGGFFEYGYGDVVKIDWPQAFQWYYKGMEHGDANAQSSVGRFYLFGRGVPKNEVEALNHIMSAAEKNNSTGIALLGYAYDNGITLDQNKDKAAKLYEDAIQKGYTEAWVKEALQRIQENKAKKSKFSLFKR